MKFVLSIVMFSFFLEHNNQSETHYHYDVLSGSISPKEMSHEYYSRISCRYNELEKTFYDSTTIKVNFLDSNGNMEFKKFFNGELYLEGAFSSSDSFNVSKVAVTDPFTDSITGYREIKTNFPFKCGTWKTYSKGKLVEIFTFKECGF